MTADDASLNLRQHLNHKVRISGIIEKQAAPITGGDDTPPASGTVNEKDLSKLKSKTVTVESDRCEPIVAKEGSPIGRRRDGR